MSGRSISGFLCSLVSHTQRSQVVGGGGSPKSQELDNLRLGVNDTAFLKKMNIFIEWIISFNFEWIFYWMNILDLILNWILNWIIFWPDSTFEWITKTNWTALAGSRGGRCLREIFLLVFGNLSLTHSAIPLFLQAFTQHFGITSFWIVFNFSLE